LAREEQETFLAAQVQAGQILYLVQLHLLVAAVVVDIRPFLKQLLLLADQAVEVQTPLAGLLVGRAILPPQALRKAMMEGQAMVQRLLMAVAAAAQAQLA